MGRLLDQLENNAKIAQEENKKLEQTLDDLNKTREDLEQKVQDTKKDETEH